MPSELFGDAHVGIEQSHARRRANRCRSTSKDGFFGADIGGSTDKTARFLRRLSRTWPARGCTAFDAGQQLSKIAQQCSIVPSLLSRPL